MNAAPRQPRPAAIGPIAPRARRDRTVPGRSPAGKAASTLADLGRIVLENDTLLDALDVVGARISETRLYLNAPASRTRLAMTYLARLKARKSQILGRLRANKIAADSWLPEDESDPGNA